MKTFRQSLEIIDLKDASYFAAGLFLECFASPFPAPPNARGGSSASEPRIWHQYVAFYKWAETHIEPVAFCNWVRYRDVYLEGGMCVRRNFYRRLPRDHWSECKQIGGVAQLVMEKAADELNDADAWFGYCGDKQAYAVDIRVGYRPTKYPFLIVKWFRDVPIARKGELEDEISALGPF